jgi:hypothetical protein
VVEDGRLGATTVFADLGAEYGGRDAWLERLRCREATDQVLVVVANRLRQDSQDAWWSELRLLGEDGASALPDAFAREIGPANVAWSPSGTRLLLEANPLNEAGHVYLYDLRAMSATRLDGVEVATVAGSGGGWLHWSGDRLAVLESVLTLGLEDRTMDVVDVDGAVPGAVAQRELAGALATASEPAGGIIVLSSDAPRGSTAPLQVRRWDPARPDDALLSLGEIDLSVDPISLRIAEARVLDADPGRRASSTHLAFVGSHSGQRALFFAHVSDSETALWRLTPPDRSANAVRTSGGWLAYQLWQPSSAAQGPFDVNTQIVVMAPEALDRARLDAASGSGIERIAQP